MIATETITRTIPAREILVGQHYFHAKGFTPNQTWYPITAVEVLEETGRIIVTTRMFSISHIEYHPKFCFQADELIEVKG